MYAYASEFWEAAVIRTIVARTSHRSHPVSVAQNLRATTVGIDVTQRRHWVLTA